MKEKQASEHQILKKQNKTKQNKKKNKKREHLWDQRKQVYRQPNNQTTKIEVTRQLIGQGPKIQQLRKWGKKEWKENHKKTHKPNKTIYIEKNKYVIQVSTKTDKQENKQTHPPSHPRNQLTSLLTSQPASQESNERTDQPTNQPTIN